MDFVSTNFRLDESLLNLLRNVGFELVKNAFGGECYESTFRFVCKIPRMKWSVKAVPGYMSTA